MALAANALVTLALAKAHLDIPVGVATFDTRIEGYIDAASGMIESYLQRKLLFQGHDERHDGRSSDRVQLLEWPVKTVTSVNDDPSWLFGATSLLGSDEFTVDGGGSVVLRARRFTRGNANVRFVYTAGYQNPNAALVAGVPTLPAAISHACLVLVEWLDSLRNDRRVGVVSKGKQGESISFTNDGMPPQVVVMLEPYRRMEFGNLSAPTGNS